MGSGFHGTFFEVFEGASLFLFAFFLFQDLVALVTLRGAEFDSAGDAGGGLQERQHGSVARQRAALATRMPLEPNQHSNHFADRLCQSSFVNANCARPFGAQV